MAWEELRAWPVEQGSERPEILAQEMGRREGDW